MIKSGSSSSLAVEPTVPEYATRIFNKDKVIAIDIKVDEEDFQEMLDNATQEEYINCDVTINGTTLQSVGIRPKGNSSLFMVASSSDTDRFSFKFEFDHFIKNQTLFGLDKMVINNNQGDATYMKEYLSYDMMAHMGVPTPLYAYAEITVNGEPWGFYLAVEALEESFALKNYGTSYGILYKPEGMGMRGAGRMNEFLDENIDVDGNDVQQDSGQDTNLLPKNGDIQQPQGGFQPNGMSSGGGTDLKYNGDDLTNYSNIFDYAVFKSTDNDYNRVIKALENLNNGTELEKYIDVDEVLRYFAVNTVVVNLDHYVSNMQHNYYLYEEDGQLSILPWDYNLSFAGFQSGDSSSAVNFPIDTPVSGVDLSERPLLAKLLEVTEYKEQYHEYLQQIVDEYFNSGYFNETIDELSTSIGNYVKEDVSAFYTYDEFSAALPVLKEFGKLRAESIQGQLSGEIPSTTAGQSSDSDALIDATDVNLQIMGSQGGGRGGFDKNIGGQFNGEISEGEGIQPGEGTQPGEQGELPMQEGGQGGFIPGGQIEDRDMMLQAIEIIQSANGDELTEEMINKLKELGLTNEQIEQFKSMGTMQLPGHGDGMFNPGQQGNPAQSPQTNDSAQNAAGIWTLDRGYLVQITIISLVFLLIGILFVMRFKRRRYSKSI